MWQLSARQHIWPTLYRVLIIHIYTWNTKNTNAINSFGIFSACCFSHVNFISAYRASLMRNQNGNQNQHRHQNRWHVKFHGSSGSGSGSPIKCEDTVAAAAVRWLIVVSVCVGGLHLWLAWLIRAWRVGPHTHTNLDTQSRAFSLGDK